MKANTDMQHLNVLAFCRDASSVAPRWPLAGMPRLSSSLFGAAAAGVLVECSAAGSMQAVTGGEAEPWLHLQAQVSVTLQCQRCLQSLTQPLLVDRRFRFVRDEAQAEQLDETADEDVLVLPPRLDLHELLEDELILALPLVPRHEQDCPTPLPSQAPAAQEPAPNPFAALAALRTGRPGGGQGGRQ